MALRAVPDHPKFANLKAILGQPKGSTLGWLEAIWHFTGRFTPQGNIGKYPDIAIEAWVEWQGEQGRLIQAMVEAGWLDADPVHRLLVHDWMQHADKATKNALGRAKLAFCSPGVRTEEHGVRTEFSEVNAPSRLPVPEPVPVPVPEPVPEAKAKKAPQAAFILPDWIECDTWNAYEEMRRRIRKPMTDHARELAVKRLDALRTDGANPSSVLNHSVLNSYQGLFDPRDVGRSSGGQARPNPMQGSSRTASVEETRKRLAKEREEALEFWREVKAAGRPVWKNAPAWAVKALESEAGE